MIQEGRIERSRIEQEQSTFEKIVENSTNFYTLTSISLWSKQRIHPWCLPQNMFQLIIS